MSTVTTPSTGDRRDAARLVAAQLVMAILLGSLIALALVLDITRIGGILAALILAIALPVVLYRGWQGLTAVVITTAFISSLTVYVVIQSTYGRFAAVLATVLWLVLLYLLFRAVRGNVLAVPSDHAVLIANVWTGQVERAIGPIAPGPLPLLEAQIARIPLYVLDSDVTVENINTQAGHNVDKIVVHVLYQVSRELPQRVMSGIPNQGTFQNEVAQELSKSLADARNDPVFWERVLRKQIEEEVDDVVREVVFTAGTNAVETFRRRDELAEQARRRMDELARNHGVEIIELRFETVTVPGERFRNANLKAALERETMEKEIEAQREATRVKLVLGAEAEIEAERMRQLVHALRSADVPLTPEVVIQAIRATSDWTLDGEYTLLPPEPRKDGRDGAKK
jgi:hypothetical protein